jgi:hypothetical protein
LYLAASVFPPSARGRRAVLPSGCAPTGSGRPCSQWQVSRHQAAQPCRVTQTNVEGRHVRGGPRPAWSRELRNDSAVLSAGGSARQTKEANIHHSREYSPLGIRKWRALTLRSAKSRQVTPSVDSALRYRTLRTSAFYRERSSVASKSPNSTSELSRRRRPPKAVGDSRLERRVRRRHGGVAQGRHAPSPSR